MLRPYRRLTMFLSTLSRRCALRFPPLAVSVMAVGTRAPPSVCGFRELTHLEQGHGTIRSLFTKKLCVFCPPSRCMSSGSGSADGKLIYKGSLGTAVRGVKMFSYSTSGASLLLMPHILLKTGLGAQSFVFQALFCGVIGCFTFFTPVLLHLLTKGYVVRLYHDPARDVYTAITYSVFLTEKKTVFHQTQVRIPSVSKMFTTFYADKTGLLVNPDLFSIPHDYNHLMGYDKPFELIAEEVQ